MGSIVAGIVKDFGIVPVMALMVMMVWFLLREIRLEVKSITTKIEELEAKVEKADTKLADEVEAVAVDAYQREIDRQVGLVGQ